MQEGPPDEAIVAHAVGRLTRDIRAVEGVPFGELESAQALPKAAGNKATGRAILDHFTSQCAEVQQAFGVTVRTLPVGPTRKVLWPTKVVGMDFSAVALQNFEGSRVAAMLAAVLFVPINKPDAKRVERWSFRLPVMWVPNRQERGQLAQDYEETRELVRAGLADELSSSSRHGQGKWLMPKTSGKNSADIVTYIHGGEQVSVRRRAFFLREILTSQVLASAALSKAGELDRPENQDSASPENRDSASVDLESTLRGLLET